MRFNMQFQDDFQYSEPEVNSGEMITETSGYRTTEQIIEEMILAGSRLDQSRRDQYDFERYEDIDEDYEDPTRRKDYDLAEASQDLIRSQFNIESTNKVEKDTDRVSKDPVQEGSVKDDNPKTD